MSSSSSFIVDSAEAAGCHDQFLLVDSSEGSRRREREYRTVAIAPGAWDDHAVGWVNACGRELSGRFDIRANDELCLLEVRVRVFLDALEDPAPDRGGEFRSQLSVICPGGTEQVATPAAVREKARGWRRTIRRMWSRQYQIRALDPDCPCPAYDVDVDVRWVERGEEQHEVNVHSGCDPDTRPNSETWYMGMSNYKVAHEFGHLLGLDDEYPPACIVTSTQSLMWGSDWVNVTTEAGRVQLFHYHHFAEWLAANRCCQFEIGRIEDIPGDFGEPRFKSF